MEPWQREFAETIAKHRRQGWGWRYDGVESWSSAAIFAQLQALGIDTDAGRFRSQAAAAGGVNALTDDWVAQIREEMDTAFWPDFPLVAVPVLWERLTPDLVCPEVIAERLRRAVKADKQGVDSPDVDGIPAAVATAVATAEYLEGFPLAERATRFDEISRDGIYDYANWILDLVCDRGREFPDVLTRVADVMADCATNRLLFRAEAAMVMAVAGRCDDAIERARAMVDEFPDDPWARILAGDVHKELDDLAGARRLFLDARTMARDPRDREAAAQRLQRMSEEPASAVAPAEVRQRNPGPGLTRPPAIEATPETPVRAESRPPAQGTKIGRNDPCPCGSGKKYKKCCLR